jgi:hypothetical protein
MRYWRAAFLAVVCGGATHPLPAQIQGFATGTAGLAFDLNQSIPGAGAGFAFVASAGVWVGRVQLGAEYGEHTRGSGRKATGYGLLLRLPAVTTGGLRPYLAAGLTEYRYRPAQGGKTHALGGSLGPGLWVGLGRSRAALIVETRLYTTFERFASIAGRDFTTVSTGLQVDW